MADSVFSDIFTLDVPANETEYAGGGFDDRIDFGDEGAQKPEGESGAAGKGATSTELETSAVDDSAAPGEGAQKEGEEKPEVKPEGEPGAITEEKPSDQAAPHTAAELYSMLLAQNATLRAELNDTRSRLEKITQAPIEDPTEDDWAENPNEAAKRVLEIERTRAAQAEQETYAARLKTAQETVAAKVVEVVPILMTDPEANTLWGNILYGNPEYANNPEGPLLAARDVAKYFPHIAERAKRGSMPPRPPQQAAPPATPPQDSAPAQNRDAQLKAGAMYGSGRGGGKTRVSVTADPNMRKYQRILGVSDEALSAVVGEGRN